MRKLAPSSLWDFVNQFKLSRQPAVKNPVTVPNCSVGGVGVVAIARYSGVTRVCGALGQKQ